MCAAAEMCSARLDSVVGCFAMCRCRYPLVGDIYNSVVRVHHMLDNMLTALLLLSLDVVVVVVNVVESSFLLFVVLDAGIDEIVVVM